MTPLSIHLASIGMTLLVLFALGTQISIHTIRDHGIQWRTLLVIGIGQWLLLPLILALYLGLVGGNEREDLAIALVSLAPGGVFAITALFLIGIGFSAALAGVLLLEIAGAAMLFSIVDMIVSTGMMPDEQLRESLLDVSRSQFLLMFVPLLVGFAMRYLIPGLGPKLAKPTRVMIWLAYIAIVGYALSMKMHFSYRVDIIATMPLVLGIIACGIFAGLAVYLISHYLLKLHGQDSVMASTLIGLQGPGPALLLTQIHRGAWPELAAVTINYALLLPLLAFVWLVISKTRWGAVLLPR